jgi:hypothetical protein
MLNEDIIEINHSRTGANVALIYTTLVSIFSDLGLNTSDNRQRHPVTTISAASIYSNPSTINRFNIGN